MQRRRSINKTTNLKLLRGAETGGMFTCGDTMGDNDDDDDCPLLKTSLEEMSNKCLQNSLALMKAVEDDNPTTFKRLIDIGVKPTIYRKTDSNGIFHVAAELGNSRIIECMLDIPSVVALINDRNFCGETPLHVAIKHSQAAAFERIFSCRRTKNHYKDKDGNTCLHLVVGLEDSPAKNAILNRLTAGVWNSSVRMHPQNKEGFTPLQYAIYLGQHKTVEAMLFAKPGLIYAPGEQAMLPIHLAAAYARHEVLKILIKHAEGRIPLTRTGRTPLHFAVSRWSGNVETDMERLSCIQTLLNERVEINAQDLAGNTAGHLLMLNVPRKLDLQFDKIMSSVTELLERRVVTLEELVSLFRPNWQIATVCFLCLRGADSTSLANEDGHTMISLAGSKEVRELLKAFSQRRLRACVQMSCSQPRSFNAGRIAICTFACSDNVADVRFNPCNHRVICWQCLKRTPLRRCPLCYSQIETIFTDDGRELTVIDNENGDGKFLQIIESAAQEIRELEDKEKLIEINKLRGRLEKLEDEVCCAICLDRRCSVVFQCGHLACKQCANKPTMVKCHICRNKIITRQTIFH